MINDIANFILSGIGSAAVCPSQYDLYEESLSRQESCISKEGQLCVVTGKFTGRAASDKYIVDDENLSTIEFGQVGEKLSRNSFNALASRIQSYFHGRKVYIVDFITCGICCRVVTEFAWQALFVSNLFECVDSPHNECNLTIFVAPGATSGGEHFGFKTNTAIACDLINGVFIITGTLYAGEIKKSVFTYVSYILPLKNELPMHSSVITDNDGNNSTIFFGLSGTGKTSLSADKKRTLLGDDEHSWCNEGIYNIEAGCYAKVINLSSKNEPSIWSASHSFMTILENVDINSKRELDFSSNRITDNTRATYKLNKIYPSHKPGTIVGHPKNIIMLTCDAHGVLPSVSLLTEESAIFHFLSGYTSKIAGTETGIIEPTSVFSRCFAAPFMPHISSIYADLLSKKISEHKPNIWLVNTGWVNGKFGVGNRIDIKITREIIHQILNGNMIKNKFRYDKSFKFYVTADVQYGDPKWNNNSLEYEKEKNNLIELFKNNCKKTMLTVSEKILNMCPNNEQ